MKWTYCALAVLLVVVIGCHGGGGSSSGGFSSSGGALLAAKSVGPEGGTIVVEAPGTRFDGMALTIPAGALAQSETIRISTATNANAPEVLTVALSPEGLTFNTTATIVVPYTDQFLADNGIADPADIRVASQNPVSGITEMLQVLAVDPVAKTVTAAVPHFSLLSLFGSATQPTGFAQLLPRVDGPVKFYLTLPDSVKSKQTMILIHGICSSERDIVACDNGVVAVLENSEVLKRQYEQVYVLNYPWKRGINGTVDEPSILNRPADFLQLALSRVSGDLPTVDIVAHSLGGLVSRYALEQVDVSKKARAAVGRLVMIATPNGGVTGGSLIAIGCAILDKSRDFQAAVDLSPFSVRLNELAGSQFGNFNVRYITIAGDVVSTDTDVFIPPAILGVAVTSVQLNEQGSTDTRPQNYEHITFHGKPGAFLDTSPAGHRGLHCRAHDPDTIGAFTSITSTLGRTFNVSTSNVGTVLEKTLQHEAVVEWTLSIPDGVFGCPAIGADGTIYVVGNGPVPPFPPKGKVYAIDSNGTLKPGWPVTVGVLSITSPVISDSGLLAVGSFNDGSVSYIPTNATPAPNSTAASVSVGSVGPPLAVAKDGAIYLGTGEGKVVALAPTVNATGTVNLTVSWTFDLGSPVGTTPALAADGTIYAGGQDGTVVALDASGSLKAGWPFAAGDSIVGAFAIAADETLVFWTTNKKLYALKPDGTVKIGWPVTVGVDIVTSPAIGADGAVFVGARDGKVYAFTSDGGTKPGWPVQPGNANDFIGVTPTIGRDGTIYVDSGTPFAAARTTALTADGALRPNWPVVHPLAAFMGMAMLQDGTLVFTTANNDVVAIRTASFGLATTGWPKFQRDGLNSGRAK